MVIFPNVIGVQQQRRCGGGEIRTRYKLISFFVFTNNSTGIFKLLFWLIFAPSA
jgi:hypothetical protein